MTLHTVHRGQFSWDGVPALDYKPRGGAFVGVTRRVLAPTDSGRPFEVRYFEVAPGGHSSLERHEHGHAVMVLRGEGGALVGKQLLELRPFDLVCVPSGAWHQFRATAAEPLGFLCVVSGERDRPAVPDAEELRELRALPDVAEFIRP